MRLAGVAQVVMPEPVPHPVFGISPKLVKAIKYYRKLNFLKTFSGSYHRFYLPKNVTRLTQVTSKEWFWKILGHNSLWMWNYCYLKYGPQYSHVQIGDSDEMPAFNFTKYGSIMNALRDTEKVNLQKKGKILESFVMSDSNRLIRCKTNESVFGENKQEILYKVPKFSNGRPIKLSVLDVLGNDSRILSRHLKQHFGNSNGKSIQRANYSLMVWYHWNWMKLSDVNYFNEETDPSIPENLYLGMELRQGTYQGAQAEQIVGYYHSRLK